MNNINEERMLPISSSMGPGDASLLPGDLEDSCNMVSCILSFEGKTYICIFDN